MLQKFLRFFPGFWKMPFMEEAFKLAEEALENNEVPVGCVFVHNGKIVSLLKIIHFHFCLYLAIFFFQINAFANLSSCFLVIDFLPKLLISDRLRSKRDQPDQGPNRSRRNGGHQENAPRNSGPEASNFQTFLDLLLFILNFQILQESELYVTLEPCIMCAAGLFELGWGFFFI